jgi:ubiquinone/menaquinone biosynthesis C-methylase UbiE
VGAAGCVYAVDSDSVAIRALQSKLARRRLHNVDAHATYAASLGFIPDASVDFVLANGLLCSVAPDQHPATVAEIKRILKPDGVAYLMAARGRISYVTHAEWEQILAGFRVLQRGATSGDNWAVVKSKCE